MNDLYCRHCSSEAQLLIVLEDDRGNIQYNNSCYKCLLTVAINQMLQDNIDFGDDETIIALTYCKMLREKITKNNMFNMRPYAKRNTDRLRAGNSLLKKD